MLTNPAFTLDSSTDSNRSKHFYRPVTVLRYFISQTNTNQTLAYSYKQIKE